MARFVNLLYPPLTGSVFNFQFQHSRVDASPPMQIIKHPKGCSRERFCPVGPSVRNEIFCKPPFCIQRARITRCILAEGPYVYSGQRPLTCTRCPGAKGPSTPSSKRCFLDAISSLASITTPPSGRS